MAFSVFCHGTLVRAVPLYLPPPVVSIIPQSLVPRVRGTRDSLREKREREKTREREEKRDKESLKIGWDFTGPRKRAANEEGSFFFVPDHDNISTLASNPAQFSFYIDLSRLEIQIKVLA